MLPISATFADREFSILTNTGRKWYDMSARWRASRPSSEAGYQNQACQQVERNTQKHAADRTGSRLGNSEVELKRTFKLCKSKLPY
jgi:hypothetical protein